MKEREKVRIIKYYYNQLSYLENEVLQLQSDIRYRRVDAVDCLELLIALERLEMFRQTMKDVRSLLELHSYDKDD